MPVRRGTASGLASLALALATTRPALADTPRSVQPLVEAALSAGPVVGSLKYEGPLYIGSARQTAYGDKSDSLSGFAYAPSLAAGVSVQHWGFGARAAALVSAPLSHGPHMYEVESDRLFAISVDAFARWYLAEPAAGLCVRGGALCRVGADAPVLDRFRAQRARPRASAARNRRRRRHVPLRACSIAEADPRRPVYAWRVQAGDLEIKVSGSSVEVLAGGVRVASGRWYSGHVEQRVGVLDDATWHAVEIAVRREADEQIATSTAGAYDERGVDVTQIDRMLALSPAERLETLHAQCVAALELLGDAPRD